MISLIMLRDKEAKPLPIKCESHKELLLNPEKYLESIPQKDRYNIFFTLGHTKDRSSSRETFGQDLLQIDIDDCEYINGKPKEEYILALREALHPINISKCVVIASGNGLQVLAQPVVKPIQKASDFKRLMPYYTGLTLKVEDALLKYGLKGKLDPMVFKDRTMGRMPSTINRKPDTGDKPCFCVFGELHPQNFTLEELSSIPVISEKDALPEHYSRGLRLDANAILEGCEFLKHCKEDSASLPEPEWYAMMSILGRVDRKLVHEYSKNYKTYSEVHTNRKLDHALKASGPRTCDGINALWGGCEDCENFGKCKSPIQLKGPGWIQTETSGFHITSRRGNIPCYDDLALFYERLNPYKNFVFGESTLHMVYNGTHWVRRETSHLNEFADENFSKYGNTCNRLKRSEFNAKVKARYIEPYPESDNTKGLLNVSNGIVNLATGELKPHSKEYNFLSVIPIAYDPKAKCPEFLEMLGDVTCGNQDYAKTLLEYFGLCISGIPNYAQVCLFLIGEGANGKSSLIQIIQNLLGKQAVSTSLTALLERFGTSCLEGKRMCICEEGELHLDKPKTELLKNLINPGKISIEEKGKAPREIENLAKVVIAGNGLPSGHAHNEGYYRRQVIVPFNAVFSEARGNLDVTRPERILKNEAQGILTLLVQTCTALAKNNWRITELRFHKEQRDDFRLQGDGILQFLKELTTDTRSVLTGDKREVLVQEKIDDKNVKHKMISISTKMLYAKFKEWSENNGLNFVTEEIFKRKAAKLYDCCGIEKDQRKFDGVNLRAVSFVNDEY